MTTDGIIFDVDGTLWDSTPVVEKAWNAALSDKGHPELSVTADRLKGLFGLPMLDIIEDIIPNSTLREREEFLPVCSRYEFRYLEEESGIVYPGLREALSALKEKGIPLYIVSNCQSGYIELLFRKTGISEYFLDHICPGDTGKFKADNIRIIKERYGLKAPVYVGDTQMDADACKEAGVPIVYAAYGFGSVREPDLVIEAPKDLIVKVRKYE
ncbi:MAG: HAD family hydrolase [Lachnospiraceae bacterium]|nr:HAD family hydrolase [Lachnospiraceae bacterium]